MGLSSEERVAKFFWATMGWRKSLTELLGHVGDRRVSLYSLERAEDVVRGWIRELDWMTGHVQQAQGNRGNIYWLCGEGDSALRGVLSQHYDLRSDAEPPLVDLDKEPKFETVAWWHAQANYSMTAARLTFHPFKAHEGLKALAAWWDCYGYLSAVAYPIFRYDDSLFSPELRERFVRLTGEMINRRFDVCFGYSPENAARTERYLLAKHAAFHALLDERTKGYMGEDYFKKKFDGYALYEEVAKMSAKDLFDFFEKQQKEKLQRKQKYADEDAKKKAANPKPDGLFGPPVPKEDEATKKAGTPKKKAKG